MASKVGIAKSALRKIKASIITSFTDGTKNANAVNDLYDPLREDLLASHNWNFATKRAKLPQTTETPVSRFDHEYQLPTDWLKTVKVTDNDESIGRIDYQEEDGKILSSADDIFLVYISNVEDPNKMTSSFRETLAFRLAADLAVDIANSNTLSEIMMKRYEKQFRKARSNDTMGDQPPRMPRGSWTSVRFSSRGHGFGSR